MPGCGEALCTRPCYSGKQICMLVHPSKAPAGVRKRSHPAPPSWEPCGSRTLEQSSGPWSGPRSERRLPQNKRSPLQTNTTLDQHPDKPVHRCQMRPGPRQGWPSIHSVGQGSASCMRGHCTDIESEPPLLGRCGKRISPCPAGGGHSEKYLWNEWGQTWGHSWEAGRWGWHVQEMTEARIQG